MTQTPKKDYSAADVKAARETMIRSAEARQAVELEQKRPVYRNKATHDQLRAQLLQAKQDEEQHTLEFNEIFRAAGHLEAAEKRQKREQAIIAEREKQQAERAATAEASAKAEHKDRFLSNGGTAQGFETAWPSMWQKLLVDRTMEGRNDTVDSLKQSGLYDL